MGTIDSQCCSRGDIPQKWDTIKRHINHNISHTNDKLSYKTPIFGSDENNSNSDIKENLTDTDTSDGEFSILTSIPSTVFKYTELDIKNNSNDYNIDESIPDIGRQKPSLSVTTRVQSGELTGEILNYNKESDSHKPQHIILLTPPKNNDNNDDINELDKQSIKDLDRMKKRRKVDPTLNGVIVWSKVANFSAVLTKDLKLKLWKGVFKDENHFKHYPEQKRINKLLRTCMSVIYIFLLQYMDINCAGIFLISY